MCEHSEYRRERDTQSPWSLGPIFSVHCPLPISIAIAIPGIRVCAILSQFVCRSGAESPQSVRQSVGHAVVEWASCCLCICSESERNSSHWQSLFLASSWPRHVLHSLSMMQKITKLLACGTTTTIKTTTTTKKQYKKKRKCEEKSFSMLVGHYADRTAPVPRPGPASIPFTNVESGHPSGNVPLRFRKPLAHELTASERRVSYGCVWFASMTAPKDLFIAAFKLAPWVGSLIFGFSAAAGYRLAAASASRARWVIYLTDARPMPRIMSAHTPTGSLCEQFQRPWNIVEMAICQRAAYAQWL